MEVPREEMLMKLGAARSRAPTAWRLVDIEMDEAAAMVIYTLNRDVPRRGWLAHIERDPRVTLLLLDPKAQHRWAQIQGRVVSLTTEGGSEHIERLALRYTGRPYRTPDQVRTIIRVEPLRVTGEDERRPWDVEQGAGRVG